MLSGASGGEGRMFGPESRFPKSKKYLAMAMLALPPPPSWYPGHMAAFAKALPSLLPKTHVVLEVRDIRLPLTSINPQLEAALAQWRGNGRGAGKACEHIVVYSKRDLVPSWGEEVSSFPISM